MKKTILLLLTTFTLMSFNDDYSIDDNSFVVVIDAAHGGSDTGIKSNDGISEKELTLAIAKLIQRIGEENEIKIILTRTVDESLTLAERTNQTSNLTPDLFISLHVNGDFADNEKSGIECYVSEKNPKYEESKKFSQILTNELKEIDGIGINDTKTANFHVLKNNTIPSVIIELGYMTNQDDLNFVSNTNNQKFISEKIVSSILKYKN